MMKKQKIKLKKYNLNSSWKACCSVKMKGCFSCCNILFSSRMCRIAVEPQAKILSFRTALMACKLSVRFFRAKTTFPKAPSAIFDSTTKDSKLRSLPSSRDKWAKFLPKASGFAGSPRSSSNTSLEPDAEARTSLMASEWPDESIAAPPTASSRSVARV